MHNREPAIKYPMPSVNTKIIQNSLISLRLLFLQKNKSIHDSAWARMLNGGVDDSMRQGSQRPTVRYRSLSGPAEVGTFCLDKKKTSLLDYNLLYPFAFSSIAVVFLFFLLRPSLVVSLVGFLKYPRQSATPRQLRPRRDLRSLPHCSYCNQPV